MQTGAERTTGYELGASGDVASGWQVAGGVAQQRAVYNVETLFDRRYYATSQGNNITPGAPRAVRLTLATGMP